MGVPQDIVIGVVSLISDSLCILIFSIIFKTLKEPTAVKIFKVTLGG